MRSWFKNNRRLALRWIGTIISLILLVWVFYNNREDIAVALKNAAQPTTLVKVLIAAGLVLLSRLFTVARWYTLLRAGGIPISFKETLRLTFAGLFGSNFLPTSVGGDVVRLAGAMQMGYDRAVCLASIAVDRLVNMAGMSLAAPFGIYQLFQVGPATTTWLSLQNQTLLDTNFTNSHEKFVEIREIRVGFFAFASMGTLTNLFNKGWGFVRKTLSSLTIWLKNPLSLLIAFAFTAGNLLCIAGAYYFLIQGMGDSLPYWQAIGLVSVGYFLGLMPFTINGYGWHETIMITLFTQVGGVNSGTTAIVVVLQRLLMMLASLPGALTLPGIMAKMDGEEKRTESRE